MMSPKKNKLTIFWIKYKKPIIAAIITGVVTLLLLPVKQVFGNFISSNWKSPELKASLASVELMKNEQAYILEGNLTDDLPNTIYVWGNSIKGKVWLQKTGENTFFSDNSIIGGDTLSYVRIYFESKGVMIGDPVTKFFSPPVDEKNNNVLMLLDVNVPEEVEGQLIVEVYCPNSETRNCDTSKIKKIRHNYKRQKIEDLKILIVDAAGREYVQVDKFREEIKDIFGNEKVLKAAWSGDGRVYSREKMGEARLYYNHGKGHTEISEKTTAVKKALFRTFSHLQNQINTAEFDLNTVRWAKDFLSNCENYGADQRKGCQTGPGWTQLNDYSNRFSPSFLEKNPDLDFVIFLPY